MGTVMKIKKAQDGLCNWSSKRGGGVSCGRGGGPKSSEWKPGRIPRMTRKEREESEKTYRVEERLKASGPKKLEHSTAPGVRDMKKGSQDFFGRDRREDEARYGKKVVKKAKSGRKVSKQSKKKK